LLWFQQSRSAIQKADIVRLLRDLPHLDRDYIAGWAGRLGVGDLLADVAS
jgi:hypothetical protein